MKCKCCEEELCMLLFFATFLPYENNSEVGNTHDGDHEGERRQLSGR